MSEYEGYDAILVRGAPRFRYNRRMIAAKDVPAHIQAQLMADLTRPDVVVPPSPADIQADTTRSREVSAPIEEDIPVGAPPTPMDFEEAEPLTDEPNPDLAERPVNLPSEEEMKLIMELEEAKAKIIENAGIKDTLKTADIFELAQELYDRFSVYTVFVGHHPQDNDVHPFHGGTMTRYELGLAYQMYNRAESQGLLQRDFTSQKEEVERGRQASIDHAQEIENRRQDPHFQAPAYQTFAERTSVEGQNKQASTVTVTRPNDPISEDVTAEADVRGTTIRPQW